MDNEKKTSGDDAVEVREPDAETPTQSIKRNQIVADVALYKMADYGIEDMAEGAMLYKGLVYLDGLSRSPGIADAARAKILDEICTTMTREIGAKLKASGALVGRGSSDGRTLYRRCAAVHVDVIDLVFTIQDADVGRGYRVLPVTNSAELMFIASAYRLIKQYMPYVFYKGQPQSKVYSNQRAYRGELRERIIPHFADTFREILRLAAIYDAAMRFRRVVAETNPALAAHDTFAREMRALEAVFSDFRDYSGIEDIRPQSVFIADARAHCVRELDAVEIVEENADGNPCNT